MIIRKNTPCMGGGGEKCQGFAVWMVRGVPSPARKHACAPEATPRLNFCLYNLL